MPKARPDRVLLDAVEQIWPTLLEIVDGEYVGQSLGHRVDGERLLTHFFECLKPGYVGWHWAVTLARAPRQKYATICEVDLLPGQGALLAPQWVPWADRLEPDDVGAGDVLPYRAQDERLVLMREVGKTDTGALSRLRTLSPTGIEQTTKRWQGTRRGKLRNRHGDEASCASCGFLLALEGELGGSFGVCTNAWSADDARVVSLTYSCGAHSETDVTKSGSDWPVVPPRVDENDLEIVDLEN